jgi:hypothetical protein
VRLSAALLVCSLLRNHHMSGSFARGTRTILHGLNLGGRDDCDRMVKAVLTGCLFKGFSLVHVDNVGTLQLEVNRVIKDF